MRLIILISMLLQLLINVDQTNADCHSLANSKRSQMYDHPRRFLLSNDITEHFRFQSTEVDPTCRYDLNQPFSDHQKEEIKVLAQRYQLCVGCSTPGGRCHYLIACSQNSGCFNGTGDHHVHVYGCCIPGSNHCYTTTYPDQPHHLRKSICQDGYVCNTGRTRWHHELSFIDGPRPVPHWEHWGMYSICQSVRDECVQYRTRDCSNNHVSDCEADGSRATQKQNCHTCHQPVAVTTPNPIPTTQAVTSPTTTPPITQAVTRPTTTMPTTQAVTRPTTTMPTTQTAISGNHTNALLLNSTTAPAKANTTPLPAGRECMTCNGPPEVCESFFAPTSCTYPNNYCINEINNQADGQRLVTRRCGTQNECYNVWYLSISDNDRCTSFDDTQTYTTQIYCLFCCTSDGCNTHLVPPANTLYTP